MQIVSAEELARLFTFSDLIEALREAFSSTFTAPTRHHHTIRTADGGEATLLLMPAWSDSSPHAAEKSFLGVKVVTVFPGNSARGRPSVSGSYLLMDGGTGEMLAIIDGPALTLWRTAAASALAASYLARPDASRLLMIGAGALAPFLIKAHASVRPIREVAIWNRRRERADALAAEIDLGSATLSAVADLEEAVRGADIISCATLSTEPLVRGAWLKPGAHVDLVGAFTPAMRESDDEAVRRAHVYVDTRAGAFTEAGDIVQAAHIVDETSIAGDLYDLCRGNVPGRRSEDEITLFKSVGTAIEDLAAARLAFQRL